MDKKELTEAENIALAKLKKLVKDASIYTNDVYALRLVQYLSNRHKQMSTMWHSALTKYLYKV